MTRRAAVHQDLQDETGVLRWLIGWIARRTGGRESAVSADRRFQSHGLDSAALTEMVSEVGEWVGRDLRPTMAWRFPTPAEFAAALADPGGAVDASAPAARPAKGDDAVAVVGMAGRFPGAPSVSMLWRMLLDGRSAVGEVPAERWDAEQWYDPDPGRAGHTSTRWGGFLNGGIADFDPAFFGLSPAEAAHMDPQQRLMLELSWESLEDAGIPPDGLRGSSTGVYAGVMWSEYAGMLASRPELMAPHSATGGDTSVVPARISYQLGLRGPSLAINTACSSSLVAVDLARRAVLSGECELALAGGVSLMCSPASTVAMSRFGAMAPDGRCKPFDAAADGYVRGEGGAVIVLKRLSRAVADGDRIYCTILGGAVNNDGFSNGLTAPSPQAQEQVIRAACADAHVDPSEVGFVETHGTGTELGDPIEAGALGAVYGAARDSGAVPLVLGAVKSNVGHMEAAAGVTGLVKAALVLRHRTIPGNPNFRSPSPHIDFAGLALEVPARQQPWPGGAGGTVRAGVSAFGFGGTNCHLVLGSDPSPPEWGRPVAEEELPDRMPTGAPVFVYGGQGSHWPGMAAGLMSAPAFARAVRRCDRALEPHLGGSIARALTDLGSAPVDTAWIQAGIFTMQVALTELWAAEGVGPAAVVGQSMGEIAAAHVCGALSLEQCVAVLTTRAELLDSVAGRGSMVVVDLGAEELAPLIEQVRRDLAIAVRSNPRRTVVSGSHEGLEVLRGLLRDLDVRCQDVDVDYASHGPQMAAIVPELEAGLADLVPSPAHIPMWSTLSGEPVEGIELDGAYWAANLRQEVRFSPVLRALSEAGNDLFVDVNPHPVVEQDVRACTGATVLATCAREETASEVFARILVGARTAGRTRWSADEDATVLVASGKGKQALDAAVAALAVRLRRGGSEAPPAELHDVAHTALVGRAQHEHRLALVASTPADAAQALEEHARGIPSPSLFTGRARRASTVFVFPGQGGQHPGMGTQLYQSEPVFRAAAHRCAGLVEAEGGVDLLPWLSGQHPLDVDAIEVVQPALFLISVSLAALWRSWGVHPDAVIGHSMGEVAAAHISGALTLPDAVRVICRRSAGLTSVSGAGSMLLAAVDEPRARELLAEYPEELEIAAFNAPRVTVLTGTTSAVERVAAELTAHEVFNRVLAVDVASHSRQVEEVARRLDRGLAGITPRAADIPFFSTVTGREHPGAALGGAYWARNLRQPVRFVDALRHASAERPCRFIEMGPHPVLCPSVEAATAASGSTAIPSLHREAPERQALLAALAHAHTTGLELDPDLLPVPPGGITELPAYPWQRQRYWLGDDIIPTPRGVDGDGEGESLVAALAAAPDAEALPLLEAHLASQLAALVGARADAVPTDQPLTALGLTSLTAMQWLNSIKDQLGVELPTSRLLRAEGLRPLAEEILLLLRVADGGRPGSADSPVEVLL
ncbi:acyltransferase domain-containing protein [Saccharopolyspora sp. 6T]|nr:acyltransferase domain-containing protein [Saccharopolyspora sp. 6T]